MTGYISDHGKRVRDIFDRQATALARRYETVTFEGVFGRVLKLLPTPPARLLDVGCGSGRDAAAMAARGYQVTAVDASPRMLAEARRYHPESGVTWIEDALPNLSTIDRQFDYVCCNAVLMFLAPGEHESALRRLRSLVVPGGVLLVGVKHGPMDATREMIEVSDELILHTLDAAGMRLLRHLRVDDEMGRSDTFWSLIVHQVS